MPTKKEIQFDKEAVLITLDQMQQALEVLSTTINRLQRYVKKHGPEYQSASADTAAMAQEVKLAKSMH